MKHFFVVKKWGPWTVFRYAWFHHDSDFGAIPPPYKVEDFVTWEPRQTQATIFRYRKHARAAAKLVGGYVARVTLKELKEREAHNERVR